MEYKANEIKQCMESMVLLVDNRNVPTLRFRDRLKSADLPSENRQLAHGDFSCKCKLPDGQLLDFSSKAAVVWVGSLEELCRHFGRGRTQFEKRFERAAADGVKMYLLVEGGCWEDIYSGSYQSLFNPKALAASMDAFRVRYGIQLEFCTQLTAGKRIHDILYRELKEYLKTYHLNVRMEGGAAYEMEITRKCLNHYKKLTAELAILGQELEQMEPADSEVQEAQEAQKAQEVQKAAKYSVRYQKKALQLEQKQKEADFIHQWVEEIEDAVTRQVFRLYYLSGLSWLEVAKKTGYRGNPDYPRLYIRDRYLKACGIR